MAAATVLAIEGDALVIRNAAVQLRTDWAGASKAIACAEDYVLMLGEFAIGRMKMWPGEGR